MNERIIVAGIIRKGEWILFGKKEGGQAPYPDAWNIPGGGVEDFERAKKLLAEEKFDDPYFHEELQRELLEETGIVVKNIKNIIPRHRATVRQMETENKHGEMTHYHFLEYLCEFESGNEKAGDDLVELRWVEKAEIRNLVLTAPSQELFRELKITKEKMI